MSVKHEGEFFRTKNHGIITALLGSAELTSPLPLASNEELTRYHSPSSLTSWHAEKV